MLKERFSRGLTLLRPSPPLVNILTRASSVYCHMITRLAHQHQHLTMLRNSGRKHELHFIYKSIAEGHRTQGHRT